MKSVIQKRFVFIAKSMLWSVLLYVVLMLAFNWDDVSNKVKGTNPITIISNIPSPETTMTNTLPAAPSILHHAGIIEKIGTIAGSVVKIIGIAGR